MSFGTAHVTTCSGFSLGRRSLWDGSSLVSHQLRARPREQLRIRGTRHQPSDLGRGLPARGSWVRSAHSRMGVAAQVW